MCDILRRTDWPALIRPLYKESLFYVIHTAGHVPLLFQIAVGCTHFSSMSAPDVTFYSSCLTKLPGFPVAHTDRPVYSTKLCWWNWKHYITIFVRQQVLACLTNTKSIAQVQLVANEAATMLNLLHHKKKTTYNCWRCELLQCLARGGGLSRNWRGVY